ncbi:MAG TPA: arginine--tRNA ligase [Spirochaetia bacterium]|nr:arginine--tRNA ligase [Spirochaetia bacterium]
MKKYRDQWRSRVAAAIVAAAGKAGAGAVDPAALVTETPPRPEMGDIAFPMFPFARSFRKAPPAIAQDVARQLVDAPEVSAGDAVEAAGPYVNVRLAHAPVIQDILGDIAAHGDRYGRGTLLEGQRVTLEFSCPNTNKPLHLGHLRNDAIGESLSRILAAAGATLRKVNLINDRGVHICKSMLAYQMFGGDATPESTGMKGDHFVGDYYVKYAQYAKDHPEADAQVREMLRRWEEGDPATVALWRKMNGWVIAGIEQSYRRTGVTFDKVYLESDIYKFGRDEVLRGLERGIFQKDADGSVWVDLTDEGMEREVLLRSDGTSIYLTQDVGTAIQRSRDWPFDRMIYVVGSEQRHHFQVLFRVLARLGYPWAASLHHLAYGMVNLPEGKMKSREGTVVDADDLLDELEGLAVEEIKAKEREEDVGDLSETARDIALGALHYWLLQITAVKDMTFDPKESISFNGNTGPYLQYTGARISSMLRKFEERRAKYSGGRPDTGALTLPEEWEIAKSLALFPETVSAAAHDLNPSVMAAYLFELCKSFSRYYQDHPVLRNEDVNLVHSRIALVRGMLQVLQNGLSLLGIPFLSVM